MACGCLYPKVVCCALNPPCSWKKLYEADGILVPGGFGSRGVEGKIAAAHYARTAHKPYLGICLGMQASGAGWAPTSCSRVVSGRPSRVRPGRLWNALRWRLALHRCSQHGL